MMEATARQTALHNTIYKRKKRLRLSAYDRGKSLYQAVSASLPTGNKARTAYLHCIKLGTNIDPLCGTGTIAIEAAMMALNKAPGLKREFVCESWHFVDRYATNSIRSDAKKAVNTEQIPKIFGSDNDKTALDLAKKHSRQADTEKYINFFRQDIFKASLPKNKGVIVTNPPYGERLSNNKYSDKIYSHLRKINKIYPDWKFNILTNSPTFERMFQKRSSAKRRLYNGRIECTYHMY